MVDEGDLDILRVLQRDCRVTVKEVARMLGKPVTTVYSRLKRLEGEGYVRGYRAILNANRLGYTTTAFVFVSFSYEAGGRRLDQREVARVIAGFPEVQEVHIVTGDWDMLLKVRCRGVEELGRFIVDKLRRVEGVAKTLTSVSLDCVKEDTSLPI